MKEKIKGYSPPPNQKSKINHLYSNSTKPSINYSLFIVYLYNFKLLEPKFENIFKIFSQLSVMTFLSSKFIVPLLIQMMYIY